MFCPNCGKELPEGVKFCAYCGKSVFEQDQQSQDQNIMLDHAIPEQDSNDAAGGFPQKSTILPQKKSKSVKVFIGLAVALVLAIGVVFAVRSSNEQSMIREIPFAIYNDGGHDKVEAYYKDYFGDSIMLGCNAEDFSISKGTNSNSFNLAGKFEATDTSQDSRPTYNAYVTGTVTTNFFRTQWSVDWSLQYQTPESQTSESQTPEGSNIIPIETLYQAFSSNPVSANNTYANQYLNVSGKIYDISYGTFMDVINVNLRYNDGLDLMDAKFQFDPSDESLNNLIIGENIVLTGYLKPDGDMTWGLTFSNASVYKSEAVANNPTAPVPDPVTNPRPSNEPPNGNANDFPPTLPPIDPNDPNADIYSDHLGRYVNEDGLILEIGVGTGQGINYYAFIYANQSDADNYTNPVCELTGGSMDYYNGYMVIDFADSRGNCVYIERDNWIEDNYTVDMYGDSYFEGVNMEPYYHTITPE